MRVQKEEKEWIAYSDCNILKLVFKTDIVLLEVVTPVPKHDGDTFIMFICN
jgi:hypothetical protein